MRNHMGLGWFYSPSQIARYIPARITSLKPQKDPNIGSPIATLRALDTHQWLMFLIGFLGWVWDSFDFFTVSLTVTEIAKDFEVENSTVTWGITITLMLRSVGAFIFGSLSDRYGRKWPFIFNLAAFIVLELGTGFTHNMSQFLGVRALYGIAMGGLFGPAAATALEDLPYSARGILSGLYQQGYAVGYLLAAAFYSALVPTTEQGWRSLFYFGAGPPVLIIIFRLCLPETTHFQVMRAQREAKHAAKQAALHPGATLKSNGMRAFMSEFWHDIKANWFLLVYMVVLMAGFNSCSHGSQDLYPTFMKNQLGMSPDQATVVTVIGQIGALIGGTFFGYMSSLIGRRLTMMGCCICGGALTYPYIVPTGYTLIAPCFFQQVFVGGVWGPIPIYLMELSPPALRSLIVGFTYQLGNLASSASATIESTIGERFPLPPGPGGKERYDYGKVIAIFLGSVWAYLLFFLFWGPEMTNEERWEQAEEAAEFEQARLAGTNLKDVGAARGTGEKVLHDDHSPERSEKQPDAERAEHIEDYSEKV